MGAIAGTLLSAAFSGRQFGVPDDTDITIILGGYTNEMKPNGDGSVRLVKTKINGAATGIIVSCDNSQEDHEFLQGLQAANVLFDATLELIDGTVYTGRCQIIGDLSQTTANGTLACELAAAPQFTRQ